MLEYVRKYRNMPFIKRGMRVLHTHNNRSGVVTGGNSSGNINVRFDGDNYSINCHPKWKMKYFDTANNLIKEYTE
jgi:hypothetical protein